MQTGPGIPPPYPPGPAAPAAPASWAPPDPGQPGSAPPRLVASVPLGGTAPVPVHTKPRSDWRETLTAAVLLVSSVATALSTLLSWHDYGRALDPRENGWEMADGSFGRGWVAVAVAVVLAVAGVLLITGRRSVGRRWALVGGAGLILLPALEWGLGERGLRSGPGAGLWVMLCLGITLLVLLAALLPRTGGAEAAPADGYPSPGSH